MRRISKALIVVLAAGLSSSLVPGRMSESGQADRQLFDSGWRFHAGEAEGGQAPSLDLSSWEAVDLPHDYMIEGKGQAIVTPGGRGGGRGAAGLPAGPEGPFDPHSPGNDGNGYLNGGIGWYRKAFTIPEADRGRRVFVEFEGVYMNSEVWLNGQSLGRRPYGYSTFQYELTPFLKYGSEENHLAVRTFVQQPCSRWYSGAGIYRHVWLLLEDPVHVAQWGTSVRTPEIAGERARVRFGTELQNQGEASQAVDLETEIRDRDGRIVASATQRKDVAPGSSAVCESEMDVARPHLWSIEDPYLYEVIDRVRVAGRVVDIDRAPLGIRTVQFTEENGFLLNGKRVQIKGVCQHHDLGPLGAAAYDRAIERQLEILKRMGVNAIRTSHNPPAPRLLDLCDRMGFVVMDEAFDEWKQNKTRFGYGQFFDEWGERDLRDMVRRDRNHPSIIMWSIGNEIPEQRAKNGEEMAARLAKCVREEDPTRPVMAGMNSPTQALETGFARPLDLLGLNYNIPVYEKVHGIGKILASETSSNYSSRDEYNLLLREGRVEIVKQLNNHCTSYDLDFPRWGNTAETEFQALRRSPWLAGEFVWTGFDYIGEPTPFAWPNRSSSFGIVDLCGFPKDRFYLYQSQWRSEPTVHILPHWNWPDEFRGKEIPVWCYTNGDSAELFLNGRSLGVRDWSGTQELHLSWQVPYEPGKLRAVARKGGRVVAEDTVETAGIPTRIELKADRTAIRAGGQDLSFVTVRVVDSKGRLCRTADPPIRFFITGAGSLIALDNGDPTNHEPFRGFQHKAFNGLCLAVVKASMNPGSVTLTAESDGLRASRVRIDIR